MTAEMDVRRFVATREQLLDADEPAEGNILEARQVIAAAASSTSILFCRRSELRRLDFWVDEHRVCAHLLPATEEVAVSGGVASRPLDEIFLAALVKEVIGEIPVFAAQREVSLRSEALTNPQQLPDGVHVALACWSDREGGTRLAAAVADDGVYACELDSPGSTMTLRPTSAAQFWALLGRQVFFDRMVE